MILDTPQHILLGLAMMHLFKGLNFIFGPELAPAAIASLYLYTREVTQQQGKHFDNDFRRGWLPWKWSREKNLETWIPVGVVLAVAFCVQMIVQ